MRLPVYEAALEEAQDIIKDILFCDNLDDATMERVNKFLVR